MPRRLLLQRRGHLRRPRWLFDTTASSLGGAASAEGAATLPQAWRTWKLQFYEVFGQKRVCVSQPMQLLIRGFREQRFVAGPAQPCASPEQRWHADGNPCSLLPGPPPALLSTSGGTLAAATNHVQGAFRRLGLLSCITGKYGSDSPTAAKTIRHF